jgi:hypothetical protein
MRIVTAEQIVRKVAMQSPPLNDEWGDCMWCDAPRSPEVAMGYVPDDGHDAECPWRMAREWVKENPE